MAVPDLPTRFPCWVKAVYSWGGESKGDLGFIEGDVIECLNAGDGSWWTGRLYRDRRSIGCFPSNFVKLMPPDWAPYRKPSLQTNNTPPSSISSAPATPSPSKQKSVFRKPFTAYEKTDGRGSPKATPSPPDSAPKKWKPMAPYTSMKTIDSHRAPTKSSPLKDTTSSIPAPLPRGSPYASQYQENGRRHSHVPSAQHDTSRAPSPQPPRAQANHFSRAASPQPHLSRNTTPQSQPSWDARIPSPAPFQQRAASPQPNYNRSASPNPMHKGPSLYHRSSFNHYDDNQHHFSRAPSPRPSFEPASFDESGIPFPSSHQVRRLASREPSPVPFEENEPESSPPPPPPAHRVMYSHGPEIPRDEPRQHAPGHTTPRAVSPAPSGHSGLTPSPLRDAMNDVMSSLDGMGIQDDDQQERDGSPPEMWGPDDYEIVRSNSAREGRPHTSIGLTNFRNPHQQEAAQADPVFENGDVTDDPFAFPELSSSRKEPPRLNTYVQRMEERLRNLQQNSDYYGSYRREENASNFPRSGAPPGRFDGTDDLMSDDTRPGTSNGWTTQEPAILSQQPSIASRSGSKRGPQERKSAFELGRARLSRTLTARSSVTNASSTAQSSTTNNSSSTSATDPSLMSGHSAGGFSATSAGSLARRLPGRSGSLKKGNVRPATAMSGYSYHPSHASSSQSDDQLDSPMGFGGLSAPASPKRGFFRRIIDSAKTTAASSRTTISGDEKKSPTKRQSKLPNGVTAIAGSFTGQDAAREMGLGSGPTSGVDWVQMRRDVNRANSISKNERRDRFERCQMMDALVVRPCEIVEQMVEGNEKIDGNPVCEPTDFQASNLALVDKHSRFIANLPSAVNPISLAQSHLCRPYRSDVQKLRAIFTWVSERIVWEDDYEGPLDAQKVLLSKRGCSEEIALLVAEMCSAVGVHAEMVRGYLKVPNENLLGQDFNDVVAHPNHWWNAVLVDTEWRIMDCSLANATNPKRAFFSAAGPSSADSWYFLAQPSEMFFSHVPLLPEQQHVVSPVAHDVLMALPATCPAFFKHQLRLHDFDTSQLHLEGLEIAQIQLCVPEDVECVAEVEARSFARDYDGDFFESGDTTRIRALAQAEYVSYAVVASSEPWKKYTIKAVLPSSANSSSTAILKVYAGKRGLMHGINSNPHALALTLPLSHQGQNPAFEFFARHPTPHALRHELYVTGPLCKKLAVNNTFVFGVRQHIADPNGGAFCGPDIKRPTSAMSIARPTSAMSMQSASVSGSAYSNPSNSGSDSSSVAPGTMQKEKPAKLAIQSPSGKIMRMTRKSEGNSAVKRGTNGYRGSPDEAEESSLDVERLGSSWEIVVKITERGTWRGLVLADRSARWCVFGEWECL